MEVPTKVQLAPFKMADDIQQSNMLIALGAQRRISETTSLSQVGNGINLEAEAKQTEADAEAMKRIMTARNEIDTMVSNYLNKLTTQENIDTQIGANLQQQEHTSLASSGIVDGAIMQTPDGIVNKLNAITDPNQKRQILLDLQRQNPQQFNVVIARLNGVQQTTEDKPLPQVKPPRGAKV